MVRLHPDKLINLRKLNERRRESRKAGGGVAPKRSYGMKEKDGPGLISRLAYNMHDERYRNHLQRLNDRRGPTG